MKEHTVNEVPIIVSMRKFEIMSSGAGPQAIAVVNTVSLST